MGGETCAKCENGISKESDGITCNGGCDQPFHIGCVAVSERERTLIDKNDNIQFVCDSCQVFCLKEINSKINKLFDFMHNLNYRSDQMSSVIKEINENTKIILSEKKSSNQTIAKKQSNESSERSKEEKSKKESTSKQLSRNERDTSDKRSDNKTATATQQRQQQINTATTTQSKTHKAQTKVSNGVQTPNRVQINNTPKTSKRNSNDAEKGKHNGKKSDTNKQNVNTKAKYAVVVRPKNQQSSNDTIKHLNHKCNPNDLQLTNVIKTKSGSVIIYCDNPEQQSKVQSEIDKNISNAYEVDIKAPLVPKIKIYGITEELSASQIEALLKRQNGFIAQGDIKVLKVAKDWKDNDLFNAIVQVDKDSFEKLMQRKKVLINWDSCIIKEHFSIIRCHNCAGFNHLKVECRNDVACGYCSKSHESSGCNEQAVACINCIVANEKYALNLNTNHNVWSTKCEIFKKKLERASRKTDYEK